jgi:hypothetical protein
MARLCHAPRRLVHVAHRGDARAQVEKLAHAGTGQVLHGAAQEAAVGVRGQPHLGRHRDDLLGHLPVDGEVVQAAQHVVVDASRARPIQVDLWRCPRRPVHPRLLR